MFTGKVKVKVKDNPKLPVEAQRRGRGRALPLFDIDARWGGFSFKDLNCVCVNMHIKEFYGKKNPSRPGPPHSRAFTITLRHTTLDRTTLYE
jgi:hypothetical protein